VQYALVAGVALFVSALTLFSGFGLGTLLMPAFALFLPVPVAVAATAVVHLANNLFKLVLVGRKADWTVVLRFAPSRRWGRSSAPCCSGSWRTSRRSSATRSAARRAW